VSATAAILLAGGGGTRMDGADKPGLMLGGRTLLERAHAAAADAGLDPVVTLGREVGGGPAAALAAGIAELAAPETVVLAVDLVDPAAVIRALLGAAPGPDGLVLVDESGREQWLAARLRAAALRSAVAAFPGPIQGVSARALLAPLELARVPVPDAVIADIDTWQDYERAKERSMTDDRDVPPELAAWVETLAYEFGLPADRVPVGDILGLASAAAHGVTRPAAPVTAFVAGLVAGQQGGTPEEIAEALAAAKALVADHDGEDG